MNNNWEALQGGYQLQMGKFRIIKFRDSDAVFLHCRVKTCLDGFEDDCAMVGLNITNLPKKDTTQAVLLRQAHTIFSLFQRNEYSS